MIRGAPIEFALEIIESIRPSGARVSSQIIVDLCKEIDPTILVTKQDIHFLETRAIGKLRRAYDSRVRAGIRKAATD